MTFAPVYIHEMNCVTPLGLDLESNWSALAQGYSGIQLHNFERMGHIYTSKIGVDMANKLDVPGESMTLLEQILLTAAAPIVERHVPTSRTALVLSSTKGNIAYLAAGKTEDVALPVLGAKIATILGLQTKPIIVSQACVSGLLALSVAKRLIQIGQYDDAIVVAGDVISEFVLSGFQAFQALSPFPCRPFDKDRAGVSLGEAAACVYVSREKGMFKILGEAAVNDANHISGPSRTGEGLVRSILQAEREACVDRRSVDFISAHGTATVYNDEMEAIAFQRLGLQEVPVHSLKGYYGHTLGASGLLETVIALQAMGKGILLPTYGFEQLGVSQPINIIRQLSFSNISRLLKTASGFGGSNAAMLLERCF